MRQLTEEATRNRIAFERLRDERGCTCHLCPPCAVCMHLGNPVNQEEDESCWEEIDEETPRPYSF
jgi:hypothetical protein